MVKKLKILAFQTVIRHFDCTLYKNGYFYVNFLFYVVNFVKISYNIKCKKRGRICQSVVLGEMAYGVCREKTE